MFKNSKYCEVGHTLTYCYYQEIVLRQPSQQRELATSFVAWNPKNAKKQRADFLLLGITGYLTIITKFPYFLNVSQTALPTSDLPTKSCTQGQGRKAQVHRPPTPTPGVRDRS